MTAAADGPTALPRRQPADPHTQRIHAPELQKPIAGTTGDNCPNCGAALAPDQRYCLHCGQRRGDPRLPFMDAVTFMESSKRQPQPQSAAAPAPPSDRRPFMSANASLVAGVATLVLAVGVGVLIGRSGDSSPSNAGNATPQIIRVGGGSGGEAEASTSGKQNTSSAGNSASSAKGPKTAAKKKAAKKLETTSSGATKATEEAYPTAPGVKLAKPEQKIGGECDPSEAGCSKNGKFEGTFFE